MAPNPLDPLPAVAVTKEGVAQHQLGQWAFGVEAIAECAELVVQRVEIVPEAI
jgi:hypothetical protein